MRQTTLSRKLLVTNLALIVGLLVIVAASMWGLIGLRGGVTEASEEYAELRLVEDMRRDVTVARTILEARAPGRDAVATELEDALRKLEAFSAFQLTEKDRDEGHQALESSSAKRVRAGLRSALDGAALAGQDRADIDPLIATLDEVLGSLGGLEQATDVAEAQTEAAARARVTVAAIGALSGLIVLGVVTMSIAGYRTVMRPLRRLQAGVRTLAAGRLEERLAPAGHREFAELAEDFNQMATELDTLYRVMEEKVAQKSRELVRSERLASVGFLAAGVAHEINNPINIISGYAELSQKWLRGTPDAAQLEEARGALEAIREEAFRCKAIVEQLLSLARFGESRRTIVSMTQVARDVVNLVGGLRKYGGRWVEASSDAGAAMVHGNEVELKQVMLNLVVNALEATDRKRGEVRIVTERRDGWIETSVTDNGSGLCAADLGQVFEPFFSRRHAEDERGIGLGLSISYAIVASHGGDLCAASDGPGRGSRFTVRLPVPKEAVVDAV